MNAVPTRTLVLTLILSMISLYDASHPVQAEPRFTSGFDFTSGKYGAQDNTYILYVPFTFKYETSRAQYRLTVPYISINAPGGGNVVAIGPEGAPIRGGSGARTTNSGLGDVVAALSYNVLDTGASGTLLDVTGKIKFGTADETKGLGTGENDYSLQLDLYKTVRAFTLFLTGGYRVYGDPPGTDFDNTFFGTIGGAYKFSSENSAGLIYDFRQKIRAGGDPQQELTAYVTHKTGKGSRIQGYVLTGFTDASPDWGGGLTFNVAF